MEIRLIACAVIALSVMSVNVVAQSEEPVQEDAPNFAMPDVFGPAGASTPAQKKQAMERARKAQEKRLTGRLNLRIAELQEACDLNAKQVRRLQLAAKGAVKNQLEGFEDLIKTMRQQMGNGWIEEVVVPADPEFPEKQPDTGNDQKKPAKDKELVAFQREMGQMFGPMGAMMSNGMTGQIEDQKLWQTQLKKTLSDQQFKKYEKLKASRKAYRRRAAVMTHVSNLDARLLLGEKQRDQLTKLVDQHLGKFFSAMPDGGYQMIGSMRYLGSTRKAMARMNQAAREFLSEEQSALLDKDPDNPWGDDFGFLMGEANMIPAPVEMALPALPELQDSGYLGVNLAQADEGVALQTVADGMAAGKAGLKTGDIVTAVDGKEVKELAELVKLIGDTKPEQKIKVSILRDGKKSEVDVTLGTRN